MRITCQRVLSAKCTVDGEAVGEIQKGLLIFVGFTHDDSEEKLAKMAQKLAHARLFEDESGKINWDVKRVEGKILSISQFTLYGDTRKGNRPSFTQAAQADKAKAMYEQFNIYLSEYVEVACGEFQADMKIEAVHDGPVTLWYEN